MKVTPLDIRRKEFKRSVRGYADEEVDLFLDEIADEFEQVYQQNADLQERMRRLDEQLATHLKLRDALEKTLVSAQFQADETKANADKEAELILRDAELKARGIVSDSYSEVQKVQEALVQLKHLEEDFRFKFQSLLEGHLKLLAEAPFDLPAGQPVVLDAAAPAIETADPTAELAAPKVEPGVAETPFVVPAGLDAVPEYPPVAAPAARPAPPVVPEPALPAAADVAAISGLPEAADLPEVADPLEVADLPEVAAVTDAQPVAESQLVWPQEPVAASADGDEDVTPPDAVTGSLTGVNDESVTLIAEDDPLKGFFFSPQRDGTDEGFFGADKGGKSKARDFEW